MVVLRHVLDAQVKLTSIRDAVTTKRAWNEGLGTLILMSCALCYLMAAKRIISKHQGMN